MRNEVLEAWPGNPATWSVCTACGNGTHTKADSYRARGNILTELGRKPTCPSRKVRFSSIQVRGGT